MKVKVHLNEWFLNCGIVGFLRILEYSSKMNEVILKENYIMFDTDILKDFHELYFNYFVNKYSIADKINNKIKTSFELIRDNVNTESKNKEEAKNKSNKLKLLKQNIKEAIKIQLKKIEKFDKETYNIINNKYAEIDTINKKEDLSKLDDIYNLLKEKFSQKSINDRLTLNLFKSILSKEYFGQQSFLNVCNSALSFEEQKNIMYKDYISDTIETAFLNEIIYDKYSMQQIVDHIENLKGSKLISKEINKIYSDINSKYINKGKELEDIKKHIKEKVLERCFMCENDNVITEEYTEGNFIPLAVSSDNMKNFFWNQNVKFPICNLCKLIMFCIPVGATSVTKTIKEIVNGKVQYKEKEIYSFVNYDTSVNELYKENNFFTTRAIKDKKIYNPYQDLILNIIKETKVKSKWKTENIFVVEFESEYLSFSRVEYFNISRHVASFFQLYSDSSLNLISDYKCKLQIMDNIFKNKDINKIINDRLREELSKENMYGYNVYLAVKTRLILNILKKEDKFVDNMEMGKIVTLNNKKLYALYMIGVSIHEEMKEENKLSGYVYKMLNSIKLNNRKDFMDMVIRLHISVKKDVSQIFIEAMQDGELDFYSIGHSFVAGLISNKYESKEGGNVND